MKDTDRPAPVLTTVLQTGYKIIRVWAFADTLSRPVFNASDPNSIWYQLLPLPPNTTSRGDGRPAASAAAAPGPVMINYGPDGLQRLDYAVSAAERFGLKLVLPFTNTWPDYGGKQMYTAAFGCNETAWFTDATCQAAYRDWVSLVVNRYKASSAIFSWQLGNEPRCPRCKVEVVREWAKSTSEFIKAIDPAHMVTLGDEGWFGPAAGYQRERDSVDPYAYQAYDGVDFVENLNIDTLDYGTFHLYPSHWGYPFEWGKAWIRQHDDAGAKVRVCFLFSPSHSCVSTHVHPSRFAGQIVKTDHPNRPASQLFLKNLAIPLRATTLGSSSPGSKPFGPQIWLPTRSGNLAQ